MGEGAGGFGPVGQIRWCFILDIFSCCFLDGVGVLGVGLGARRPEFAVLDCCITFLSFSSDGVCVLGVGLSARGPFDHVLRRSTLA